MSFIEQWLSDEGCACPDHPEHPTPPEDWCVPCKIEAEWVRMKRERNEWRDGVKHAIRKLEGSGPYTPEEELRKLMDQVLGILKVTYPRVAKVRGEKEVSDDREN